MNGAVARSPETVVTFTLSDPLNTLSLFVSYAGPPRNEKAYKLALGAVHAVDENVVVVKKTISPATAGKAVTFSSTLRDAVFASAWSAVFGDGTLPLSLMPI